MQRLSVLLLLVALACAESNNPSYKKLRPQPRQIFRDGFNDDRESFNRRRPGFKDQRQRQDPIPIGQLPLGPTPAYGESDFEHQEGKADVHLPQGVEEESLFDLGAFSSPNIPRDAEEKSSNQGPEEHYDEENTEQLSEYIEEEERYNTDDHEEPALNYVEDAEYTEETRSPAHRYPDEDLTTKPYKVSSRDEPRFSQSGNGEQYATPIPLIENEFNPFSLFSNADQQERFDNDPPKKQNSAEQFHQSSSKFEVAADPYADNKFKNSRAQDRNYETRTSIRDQQEIRKPTIAYNQRPSSRHAAPRQQLNQALNPNLIPRDPYYEEQRPRRPVTQHRPQRIHHLDGGDQGYVPPPNTYNPADYEDDEDEDKPDRLSELLLQSKFKCGGQKDGYYADEGVNCEVFHFCQVGVKHSWLCPNGAAFHQVHLICMPHSEDNICERSSNFHFVNDFLYKEVGNHPQNMSYVERYYPLGYEGGVANIPHHEDGFRPPQAAQQPSKHYRPRGQRPHPPPNYQVRQEAYQPRTENEQQPQYQIQARRPSQRYQAQLPGEHHPQERDERPIRQENANHQRYQLQELNKPQHVQEERTKRPEYAEQGPSHEIERPHLPRQQGGRPEFDATFRPTHENNPHFKRPQFDQKPPQSLQDSNSARPSAHFQQHRSQPTAHGQQFGHSIEQTHRPNQNIRPTPLGAHDTPVYHPQQFFPGQGRTQHGSASIKVPQFRLIQEGRRQKEKKESSLNPLSFLG